MSERIDDGFSTLYTFAANGSIELWEKEVTPPSVEAGGEVDITTMRNTAWRTKNPKKLKTLGESSATCAYDPAVYDSVVAMIGVNQLITITFADGDQLQFWGWLESFTPGACAEGEQPTADITIIASNKDDSGAEVAPVRVPA